MENELDRNDLVYKTCNKKKDKTFDFQKFKITYNNDLSLDDTF